MVVPGALTGRGFQCSLGRGGAHREYFSIRCSEGLCFGIYRDGVESKCEVYTGGSQSVDLGTPKSALLYASQAKIWTKGRQRHSWKNVEKGRQGQF